MTQLATAARARKAGSPSRSLSAHAASRRHRLMLGVGVLFVMVSLLLGFPTGREVVTP